MTGRSGIARGAVVTLLAFALASCMMAQQGGQDSQGDPNIPGYSGLNDKIQWIYNGGFENAPFVTFVDSSFVSKTGRAPAYMGWNQKGSWFKNDDGRVVVWNLKQNSLTVRYKSDQEIPQEEIASMKNFQGQFNYLLPKTGKPAKPASTQPDIVGATIAAHHPDPRADLKKSTFGDPQSVRAAVDGVQGGATPPGAQAPVSGDDISGTGAMIQGGVLTFTLADHSAATYKVVRPKVMQNNPQASAADISGAWIAMEENGKGLLFTVRPDKSVTAKEMPAQVVQMLMQGGPQR
jgi:hypothetical protein